MRASRDAVATSRIASWSGSRPEGWYDEYGVAHPGYQSHGSFYLVRLWQLSGDDELAASLGPRSMTLHGLTSSTRMAAWAASTRAVILRRIIRRPSRCSHCGVAPRHGSPSACVAPWWRCRGRHEGGRRVQLLPDAQQPRLCIPRRFLRRCTGTVRSSPSVVSASSGSRRPASPASGAKRYEAFVGAAKGGVIKDVESRMAGCS